MGSNAPPGVTREPTARPEREGHGFPQVPALPGRLRLAIRRDMETSDALYKRLRQDLDDVVGKGLSADPATHALQVAGVAGILTRAFERAALRVTLVGGGAIEIHAPGTYLSHDVDVVLEGTGDVGPRAERVFRVLGFNRVHRHWVFGETLFVETVPRPVAGPTEVVEIGDARFRVVKKEVPLRDRVVGFKHWEVTAYGAEAMVMIVAFAGDLDESWLFDELRREDAVDAFEALGELVKSGEEVTEKTLRDLLDRLHRRQGG